MTWYDNGMPMSDHPDVLATAELIRRLYTQPGCDLGGPLHAMLDDGNYEDEQLDSSYYRATGGRAIETYLCRAELVPGTGWVHHDELDYTPEVADLCRLILASFRRMPESWRAAAIAHFDGTIAKHARTLAARASTTQTATAQQVNQLIVELRREIAQQDAPPEPKPCASVPCPPWTVHTPHRVTGLHEPHPPFLERLAEAERHPDPGMAQTGEGLRDIAPPHWPLQWQYDPRDAPGWQQEAWSHMPEVLRKLTSGEEMRVQLPTVVSVPADVDPVQLAEAVALCQRAGLLPTVGVLFMPADLNTDESNKENT